MTKEALHGILAMLSGEGEKKNRAKRREFHAAIPETGTDRHPAVSGPLARGSEAFGYRRANACHGPKSKREHEQLDHIQEWRAAMEKAQQEQAAGNVSNRRWLAGLLKQKG